MGEDPTPDRDPGRVLLDVVFGDLTGAYVFVAAMVFFGVYWSVTFFSTDTLTVANTLVAVSEGHLHIDAIVYGPSTLGQPGTHLVDGRLYGRNYGQVAVALPILLAVRGFAAVADLGILLVGAWCLGVLALIVGVGSYLGRRERATVVGSGVALLLFALNAGLATRIPARMYPLVALQVASMVAAALVAVVLYRWLASVYDERVGFFAGIATAVATPVGFWASIPKRHSLTTLFAVLVLYSFYRSRSATDDRVHRRFRVLSYVWVALTAWVHGGEAFVLLLALALVDFPTARSNAPRRLAVVAAVFAVALLPFLLTNAVVSGNPVQPPRLTPAFDSSELPPGVDPSPGYGEGVSDPGATPGSDPGGEGTPAPGDGQTPARGGAGTPDPDGGGTPDPGGGETPEPGGGETPDSGGDTPAPGEDPTPGSADGTPDGPGEGGQSDGDAGGGSGGFGPFGLLTGVVGAVLAVAGTISSIVTRGADLVTTTLSRGPDVVGSVFDRFWGYASTSLRIASDAERMTDVFVRGGYIESLSPDFDIPVNLAMLESMPLLGTLAAVPVLAVRGARVRARKRSWSLSPARQTDVLAVAVLVLFLAVYLPRLPIHHMYTVRYLHPFYPVGLYLLVRIPAVRNAMTGSPRTLVGAYGGTVVVGVPLFVLTLGSLELVQSEAVQLYGLCALTLAGMVGFWAVLDTWFEDVDLGRPGAAVLGVAAGAMTVYLLVGGVELFATGEEAVLPVVRFVGGSIRTVTG